MPTILALAFLTSGIVDGCDHQPDRRPPRISFEILQSGTHLGLGFEQRWFVVCVSAAGKASGPSWPKSSIRFTTPTVAGAWTTVAFQALRPADDLDVEPEGWSGVFALGVVRPDGVAAKSALGLLMAVIRPSASRYTYHSRFRRP